MDRESARQEIHKQREFILSRITQPAAKKVKGKFGYVCPIPNCGHGKTDEGLIYNPKTRSKNGYSLKCFDCGFSGDIIDLYQQMTGCSYGEAIEQLADICGIVLDPYQPSGRPTPAQDFANAPTDGGKSPTAAAGQQQGNCTPKGENAPQSSAEPPTADYSEYYRECAARLTDPAAVAYLKARGISTKTAAACGIGFDPAADPANAPAGQGTKRHPCPRLIIPSSPSHYVGRRIDGGEEYKKVNAKGSTPAIFNAAALTAQEVQNVFITEGAFDALSVLEAGAAAIALNSTANVDKLLQLLDQQKPAAPMILCLDNDGAGKAGAKKLQEGLQERGIFYTNADICLAFKDPNEAITKDRAAFFEAVQMAQEWSTILEERAKEAAREEEIERQRRTGAGMVDSFLSAVTSRIYEPMPTGIADIDKAIGGGLMRQQLVLLGAAPAAGKTALAQWIFEGMAKRGTSCVYVNLEMSREQMLARSIARIAAWNGDKITPTEILQGYKWTAEQAAAVNAAAEEYKQTIAPRLIYNPDGVTADLDSILQYIEAEAERAKAAALPAPVVVLDYLQIVRGTQREDDAAVIKRAVAALKKFAIVHNTVVFVIIAHNRGANESGNVTMQSGRDTSALEYSADLQLALTFTACLKSEGGKKPDELTEDERHRITLKVVKGRFAKAGTTVNLYFDGASMSYTQLTRPERPQPKQAGRRW